MAHNWLYATVSTSWKSLRKELRAAEHGDEFWECSNPLTFQDCALFWGWRRETSLSSQVPLPCQGCLRISTHTATSRDASGPPSYFSFLLSSSHPLDLSCNAGGEFIWQPGAWVHCGWQADNALIGAKSVDTKWDSIAMPFCGVEGRGRILNINASREFVLVFFSNAIFFLPRSSGTVLESSWRIYFSS